MRLRAKASWWLLVPTQVRVAEHNGIIPQDPLWRFSAQDIANIQDASMDSTHLESAFIR